MKRNYTLERGARWLAVLMVVLATALPATAVAAPLAQPEAGTITGTVFRDYNANGTQDTNQLVAPYLKEPTIAGVIVTAYDSSNTVQGTTTTVRCAGAGAPASYCTGADLGPNYSLAVTGTGPYRIEFTLPNDGSLDYLEEGATSNTAGQSTDVRFVNDPGGGTTANINKGYNNPTDYSQTNPPLVTAQTAYGPRNPVTAGAASAEEPGLPTFTLAAAENANQSVISIPYTADGNLSNTNNAQRSTFATLKQTGTLFGMAYNRQLKLVFAGTYFKSYADTGPIQSSGWLQNVDPLGAVYAVTPVKLTGEPPNNDNARVYANLNKIKDPTSADPFIPGNPAGVDPRRTGGINYDINDCDGPVTTDPGQASPASGLSCWRHDPVAFDKVGAIGLGDVESDDKEQTLFVVNLADKKLYQLPVESNPANWPIQTLAAPPVAIPNNCAQAVDALPGGLGFRDGQLYVGVTCTAKSTQDPDELKAEVWRFNPQTQVFSASPVFTLNLGYPRGCIFANNSSINQPKNVAVSGSISRNNCQDYNGGTPNTIDNMNWLPWPTSWQQTFTGNRGINSPGKAGHTNLTFIQLEYPNPWLSDISFDGDDLLIGFRDTNGDRTGNAVRSPNISTNNGFPTHNYVVDNFSVNTNPAGYQQNNGNVTWTGDWSETGETTNPTSGSILVANNVSTYQLRVSGLTASSTVSVQRAFSSSTLTTVGGAATLSFAYRRIGLEAGDSVAVQVSTAGIGGPYTTVTTIDGPASNDPTYQTVILGLTGLTPTSALRFEANAAMDTNDQVWIDNVRIENATASWMANYTYSYTGSGFGDLLRACWNGTTWVLESNGTCGTGAAQITTPGADNGQGPGTGAYPGTIGSPFTGYGEFYWDDSGPGSRNPAVATGISGTNQEFYVGHEQTMMGGIFQQSGLPDVAVTIADQFGYGDGGLARFSSVVNHPLVTLEANGNLLINVGTTPPNLPTYPIVLSDSNVNTGNEAGLALRHTQLYGSGTGFFAKANGLGDIEALQDPAPIEVGNRLWIDNGNGTQDPGETVLNNVVVELWKDTNNDGIADTKVAQTTTNTSGNYLFSFNGNPNSPNTETWTYTTDKAVLPNTVYEIRIDRGQSALSGNSFPTIANAAPEQRDSDGVTIPDTNGTSRLIAGLRFTTGGPGVNDHTYDFGFYPTSATLNLGNQVWYDINNNGVLDAGEASIDGVKVDLYADSNGDGVLTPGLDTLIATQNTSGGGLYNFTGLLPGSYIVHLPQSNFAVGQPLNGMASSTGNNPTPDPDNDVNNDDNGYHIPGNGVASLAVTLTSGGEPIDDGDGNNGNLTVDFGFFGLGAIGNYVWVDENSDGYQDEGEPGIANVQVNLYDGVNPLPIATTYTDSHGGYLFDNLKPGTYYVDVLDGTGGTSSTLPAGMTQTPPSTLPNADFGNQSHGTVIPGAGGTLTGYPVTIGGAAPLENLTADFGYNYNPAGDVNNPPTNPGGTPAGAAVAALGDRVWIDSNGNGAQDPNEIGVSGVTVQIFTAGPDGIFGTGDDVPGATQITNANGYYMFDGLAPGAYVVKVTSDSGASHAILTSGQYNQTGDPDHFGVPGAGVPSDTDNATTTPVLLGPGDVFLNADFGYQPSGAVLGSIGDTIWFDANANGTGPSLAPIDGGAAVTQGNQANPADTNEYGIPGVTVVLIKDSNGDGRWDAGEPIVATTTTNANGQYLFPGLPIADGTGTDDYIVWVNDSNNVLGEMAPTYDKDGRLLPASPSIRTGLGISAVTNLGTTGGTPYGTNDARDQDFGYTNTYQQLNPANPAQPLGLIGDYVWFDSNRNNLQDEPGRGVEGVVVELLNSTGTTVIATTVTDENGYYSFGGLPLNTSYIVRIPPSNFLPGAPLEGTTNTGGPAGGSGNSGPVVNLTVANPVNLVQDFGYAAPTAAQGSIGNQVWEDLNANGIRDAGEPAIQGVTIDLYRDLNGNGTVDPGEPLMGTRTTDVNGQYLFSALPIVGGGDADSEAEYVVDVTDVNGVLAGYWHSLSPNQDANTGISGNTANDAQDNSKVDPFAVEIGSGAGGQPVSNNLNVDFGYYVKPAAVGNFVWIDSNANGIQDAGEPGIDGVTIQMRVEYPDGTIHSIYTVTGDDPSTTAVEQGWYSFGNLLLDEDYSQSSTGATPLANQPRYVIVSPPDVITVGSTTYNLTAPNQGGNDMVDSDNAPGNDETASSATQGRNNVTQNANAGNESNPNAGYDFGYAIPMDMGDLPDTPYPTTVGSNGARHQLTSALKLGVTVDAEYNGQPNAAASGDDNDGTTNIASLPGNTGDDEDGVSQAPGAGGGWKEGTVVNSLGGALQVVISGGSGVPQVFMDFTGSGLTGLTLYYDDDNNPNTPLVQYNGTTALPAASYRFYFDIPTGACPIGGNAIETRVRLSAAGGLSATGLAPDGEVEDYVFDCSSAPLAVLLSTFDATAQTDHVLVAWETVSEVSNAGFNLYRSLAADGERTLLTTAPSAAPGSTQGAAYSFQDADVLAGQTYWYFLEDIDLSGATTLHGPVSVAFSGPTAVTLNDVSAGSQGSSLNLTWLLLVVGLAAAGLAALTLRRRSILR